MLYVREEMRDRCSELRKRLEKGLPLFDEEYIEVIDRIDKKPFSLNVDTYPEPLRDPSLHRDDWMDDGTLDGHTTFEINALCRELFKRGA